MKICPPVCSPRLLGMVMSLACLQILPAEPIVQSGQTIAFLGDSITQHGAAHPSGYVRLVESGLKANGIEVKVIGAGISAHKSNQMLERLQQDVLDKKPALMTLSCGVNDVWHGAKGVSLEDYKKNITEIVDRCAAAGVKVVILTATPIRENDNENNQKLAGYNAFLKQLATEHKLPLADLSAAMWAELNKPTHPRPPGDFLTVDGVHMNPLGNEIMAIGVLEAFGLDAAQMSKAREVWLTQSVAIRAEGQVTKAEWEKIMAVAAQQKKPANAVLGEALAEALKTMASPQTSEQ